MNTNHETERMRPTATPRKPYTKPRLTCYGHVRHRPGSSGTGADDVLQPQPRCVLDRRGAVRVDTPRTRLVRGWLIQHDQSAAGVSYQSLQDPRPACRGPHPPRNHPAQLFIPLFDYLVIEANGDTARMLKQRRLALPIQN